MHACAQTGSRPSKLDTAPHAVNACVRPRKASIDNSRSTHASQAALDSFTPLEFENARVVRSNLGSQGGRCSNVTFRNGETIPWFELCDEEQSALLPPPPAEIYLRDVGTTAAGVGIDLRITNESQYRAWNSRINGVKRTESGFGRVDTFGVVNLLGPRLPTQRPLAKFWSEVFTYAQLRLSFVDGTGLPLTLYRTFLTFFDFDAGDNRTAVETIQLGPPGDDANGDVGGATGAAAIWTYGDQIVSSATWEEHVSGWADFHGAGDAALSVLPSNWSTPIYAAHRYIRRVGDRIRSQPPLAHPHAILPPTHPISSHPIPSHPIPSHPIPSHPIPSHPIPSHPIPCSHPIPSCPIPSHTIPSHPISSYRILSSSYRQGVGEDNPLNPSNLTMLQSNRSMMVPHATARSTIISCILVALQSVVVLLMALHCVAALHDGAALR
jgi:hypothetical protein